jgi:copper chaperone CopZ
MTTKQNDIVEVNLSLETPSFSTEDSFSVPLIIATLNNTDERVQTFSDLDGVEDAGYEDTTDIYKFAASYFGQTGKEGGRPNLLKLGKKSPNANCTQVITFNADASGGTYTIKVGDLDATAAIAYDGNVAAVKAALEAVSGIAEVTVALNSGATVPTHKEGFTIEFTGADANTDFAEAVIGIGSLTSVTTATVNKTIFGSAVETWGAAYSAIKAEDTDFWFVIPTDRVTLETEVDTLPAGVEADEKALLILCDDSTAKTSATTDIGSTTLARFVRLFNFYSGDATYALHMCELGAVIPDFFGSANPSYYPLALITADTLTTGEIGYLVSKNYARCEQVNLKNVIPGTSKGSTTAQGVKSTTGVSIKKLWIKDYMSYVISNAVLDLLMKNKNVYFSDFWFTAIEDTIRNTMQNKGVNQGLLLEGSINIVMPALIGYDTAKKLNEFLDGITADSESTNPISKIKITGKIG